MKGLEMDVVSLAGAEKLFADTKTASLLAREARQRAVIRVWGLPREDQSRLVTIVLFASAVTVASEAMAKFVPHPTSADLKIGASVVNTAAGGLAGLPPATMPLAGAFIAYALLFREVHNAAHDLRVAAHELHTAFRHRYGHLIALRPRPS